MSYRRLHVLVEGRTEEILVRELIAPHLQKHDWWVNPSIVKTKRVAGGASYRGGVGKWGKIEKEIRLLLGDSDATVTMLFDYYGFPEDAPGMADRSDASPMERVRHVEAAIAEAVDNRRLRSNLVLHETEAWVFAAADELGELLDAPELAATLHADCAAAGGPELVNSGREQAPSKRLLRYRPLYDKVNDGPLAVCALGVAELRRQCPHFDEWLSVFEH